MCRPVRRKAVEKQAKPADKRGEMSNQGPEIQTILAVGGVDAFKDACHDRNTIRSEKLEGMAKKGW